MGADWIDPVLTYGCFVAFKSFSFKKIKCNHGENEQMFAGDDSDAILDAFQYVVDCWEIFVGRFLEKFLKDKDEAGKKEYLEICSKIKCNFACTNVRGYYEKLHFPNDAFFVFGYDSRQIGNLKIGEIREKLGDLPQDLDTRVAEFLYLFNETDVFWEICEDDAEEESESSSKSDEKTESHKRSKSEEGSENEDSDEENDGNDEDNNEENEDEDEDSEDEDDNENEDSDESQKECKCTLSHFNSINFGKAELEKIDKYKAKVGNPRFHAGCY